MATIDELHAQSVSGDIGGLKQALIKALRAGAEFVAPPADGPGAAAVAGIRSLLPGRGSFSQEFDRYNRAAAPSPLYSGPEKFGSIVKAPGDPGMSQGEQAQSQAMAMQTALIASLRGPEWKGPQGGSGPPATVKPIPPNPGSPQATFGDMMSILDKGAPSEFKYGPNGKILKARYDHRMANSDLFGPVIEKVERVVDESKVAEAAGKLKPANESLLDAKFNSVADRLKKELQDKMDNDPARWLVEDGMTRADFADAVRKAKPRNEPMRKK
jgi:hypothetical protein